MNDKLKTTPEQQRYYAIYDAGVKDIEADYAEANQIMQAAIRDGDNKTAFSAHEAMRYQQSRRAQLDNDLKQALTQTIVREQAQTANRLTPDEREIARGCGMTDDEWVENRDKQRQTGSKGGISSNGNQGYGRI